MLVEVKTVDEGVVRRLTDIYAESMDALEKHFPSRERMLAEYAAFAADFARQENQRILAESRVSLSRGSAPWRAVSALRAIEAQPGSWFLEAVETMPSQRGKGYGKALVLDTLRYLEGLGAREVTCTIARDNAVSRAMHESCGFVKTDLPPVNPWGETEDGCLLYRFRTGA